jgi:hypothetical protein
VLCDLKVRRLQVVLLKLLFVYLREAVFNYDLAFHRRVGGYKALVLWDLSLALWLHLGEKRVFNCEVINSVDI